MINDTDFQAEQVKALVLQGLDITAAATQVFGCNVKYYRKVPKEVRDEIYNLKFGDKKEDSLVRINVSCTVGQLFRLREKSKAKGKTLSAFINALMKQELNKGNA